MARIRKSIWIGFGAAVTLCLVGRPLFSATESMQPSLHEAYYHDILEQRFTCGRNALFILAALCNRQAAPEAFESVTSLSRNVDSRGVSILQLRDAALAMGLPCNVRLLTKADLVKANLPVIAHFWTKVSDSTTGHFVVLIDIDADHVWFIDPTAATFHRYPVDTFWSQWTGFILEPSENTLHGKVMSSIPLVLWGTPVLGMLAALFLFKRPIANSTSCDSGTL